MAEQPGPPVGSQRTASGPPATAATSLRVSAIVVGYQVRALPRRCLETLKVQVGVELEIIVVDNASADGSAHMVPAGFLEVRLICKDRSVGFARANNQRWWRCGGPAGARRS